MSFISPVPTDAGGEPRQTGSQQVLGKDDFLRLLVTKLQHQDPLKPMKDEAFASQLAQFSSLEQMQNIADGIEASNQYGMMQMQSLNNAMASGLIGKQVEAGYNQIRVEGGNKPRISFTLPDYAKGVTLAVKDGSGQVISTLKAADLPAGAHTLTWDATDTQGNRVPDGAYSVEASAVATSGARFQPKLSLIGIVESIRYRNGSAYLQIGGAEVPLGDVSAVGLPGELD